MDVIQEFAIQELEAQTAMRLEMQILQENPKEVSSPVDRDVVTFFDKKKEYRSLSNFWENPVVLYANGDQKRYNSGEAAFHGEKYGRLSWESPEDRQKELANYSKKFEIGGEFGDLKGIELKRRGGKNGLKLFENELILWNQIAYEVQKEICKYKHETYQEVRKDLKKSGIKILVHPAARVSNENIKKRCWEGRVITNKQGNLEIIGKNWLGEIWMQLR